jgi:hypothetical protein
MTTLPSDAAAAVERVRDMIKALGPEYALAVEARRENERQRKRDARQQQTPEQIGRERERKREARASQPPRPFLAIDGEGGGTDHLERQHYLLMIAADASGATTHMKHNVGNTLSPEDCFEFLLNLPSQYILVAFGIGYDATQILRHIPDRKLREIINPRQGKNGPVPIFFGEYAITYQQGQYLRVARIDRSGPKPRILKGSSRTIYETLGFFQSTFVKAITDWSIGTAAERAVIKANKDIRDEFAKLTDQMIEYCTLECRYLAALMTEFREVCYAAGIRPERWAGAGWLAAAMLKKHGALKRPLTVREQQEAAEKKSSKTPTPRRPVRDREFEIAGNLAYYGGRFEVARIGFIPGPLYEYDLKSAYPAAMLQMPCPHHTRWVHSKRKRLPTGGELYLARVTFAHPPDSLWCGFPFRQKGGLFWPVCGTGWYWSPEIEAACQYLQADIIAVHDVWIAKRCYDCRPYDWINDVYAERQRLGGSTKGYPLKLALNSLYGKRAQRSGRGPYHDVVEAGLITAITRARIMEAVGQDPEGVVMIATDAVMTSRRLALDIGKGLGQWEEKIWPDLFIAQPGVYFSPTRLGNNSASELTDGIKSRGVKRSVIGKAAPQFMRNFEEWFDLLRQPGARELILTERKIPAVPVTVHLFYGNRLALHRGKSWLAGQWKDETRHETFEWDTKRHRMRVVVNDDGNLTTYPRVGPLFEESEGYKPADFDKLITVVDDSGELEATGEDVWLEGMPDHIDFLPHEE